MTTQRGSRGSLGMYVVVKPNGTLYVAEDGSWIFDRETARHILSFVGGKIKNAGEYA